MNKNSLTMKDSPKQSRTLQSRINFKYYWSLYISGFIILLLIASYFLIPAFQEFAQTFWETIWSDDEARISNYFKNFGVWGPLLIIFVMVLQMFLIVFPTWLPMIVAVLGYGGVWGTIISVISVFVSSTIGYYLGERMSGSVKKSMIGEEKYEKMSAFMKTYGFWAVVLFRISPFLSNDAMSFIAGIIKMGYKKYLLATMIGIIPLACAIGYFGKDTETLEEGLYWIGGFGIVFYGVYLYMSHRKNKKI